MPIRGKKKKRPSYYGENTSTVTERRIAPEDPTIVSHPQSEDVVKKIFPELYLKPEEFGRQIQSPLPQGGNILPTTNEEKRIGGSIDIIQRELNQGSAAPATNVDPRNSATSAYYKGLDGVAEPDGIRIYSGISLYDSPKGARGLRTVEGSFLEEENGENVVNTGKLSEHIGARLKQDVRNYYSARIKEAKDPNKSMLEQIEPEKSMVAAMYSGTATNRLMKLFGADSNEHPIFNTLDEDGNLSFRGVKLELPEDLRYAYTEFMKAREEYRPDSLMEHAITLLGTYAMDAPLFMLGGSMANILLLGSKAIPFVGNIGKIYGLAASSNSIFGKVIANVMQQAVMMNIVEAPNTIEYLKDGDIPEATGAIWHNVKFGATAGLFSGAGEALGRGLGKYALAANGSNFVANILRQYPQTASHFTGTASSFGLGYVTSEGTENDKLANGIAMAAMHFTSPHGFEKFMTEKERRNIYTGRNFFESAKNLQRKTNMPFRDLFTKTSAFDGNEYYLRDKDGKMYVIDAEKFAKEGVIEKKAETPLEYNPRKYINFNSVEPNIIFGIKQSMAYDKIQDTAELIYKDIAKNDNELAKEFPNELKQLSFLIANQQSILKVVRGFRKRTIPNTKELNESVIKIANKYDITYEQAKAFVGRRIEVFVKDPTSRRIGALVRNPMALFSEDGASVTDMTSHRGDDISQINEIVKKTIIDDTNTKAKKSEIEDEIEGANALTPASESVGTKPFRLRHEANKQGQYFGYEEPIPDADIVDTLVVDGHVIWKVKSESKHHDYDYIEAETGKTLASVNKEDISKTPALEIGTLKRAYGFKGRTPEEVSAFAAQGRDMGVQAPKEEVMAQGTPETPVEVPNAEAPKSEAPKAEVPATRTKTSGSKAKATANKTPIPKTEEAYIGFGEDTPIPAVKSPDPEKPNTYNLVDANGIEVTVDPNSEKQVIVPTEELVNIKENSADADIENAPSKNSTVEFTDRKGVKGIGAVVGTVSGGKTTIIKHNGKTKFAPTSKVRVVEHKEAKSEQAEKTTVAREEKPKAKTFSEMSEDEIVNSITEANAANDVKKLNALVAEMQRRKENLDADSVENEEPNVKLPEVDATATGYINRINEIADEQEKIEKEIRNIKKGKTFLSQAEEAIINDARESISALEAERQKLVNLVNEHNKKTTNETIAVDTDEEQLHYVAKDNIRTEGAKAAKVLELKLVDIGVPIEVAKKIALKYRDEINRIGRESEENGKPLTRTSLENIKLRYEKDIIDRYNRIKSGQKSGSALNDLLSSIDAQGNVNENYEENLGRFKQELQYNVDKENEILLEAALASGDTEKLIKSGINKGKLRYAETVKIYDAFIKAVPKEVAIKTLAKMLNDANILSAHGNEWTEENLTSYMEGKGLKRFGAVLPVKAIGAEEAANMQIRGGEGRKQAITSRTIAFNNALGQIFDVKHKVPIKVEDIGSVESFEKWANGNNIFPDYIEIVSKILKNNFNGIASNIELEFYDKLINKFIGDQLYQTFKGRTAPFSALTPEEMEALIHEAQKRITDEWKIEYNEDLDAAGVTNFLNKSIQFGKGANWSTMHEEILHAATQALGKEKAWRSMLMEKGWDGKGDMWDVGTDIENSTDAQIKLRLAHEELALDYLDYIRNRKYNNALFNKIRNFFEKVYNWFNGNGWYSKADYFRKILDGKLEPRNINTYANPSFDVLYADNLAEKKVQERYDRLGFKSWGEKLLGVFDKEYYEDFMKNPKNAKKKIRKEFELLTRKIGNEYNNEYFIEHQAFEIANKYGDIALSKDSGSMTVQIKEYMNAMDLTNENLIFDYKERMEFLQKMRDTHNGRYKKILRELSDVPDAELSIEEKMFVFRAFSSYVIEDGRVERRTGNTITPPMLFALKSVLDVLKDKKYYSPKSFIEIYKTVLQKLAAENKYVSIADKNHVDFTDMSEKEKAELFPNDGRWHKYERITDPDDVKAQMEIAELTGYASKTNWCTATLAAEQLQWGDFYIYVVDEQPHIAIRMFQKDIAETRGIMSGQVIEPAYEGAAKAMNEFIIRTNGDGYAKSVVEPEVIAPKYKRMEETEHGYSIEKTNIDEIHYYAKNNNTLLSILQKYSVEDLLGEVRSDDITNLILQNRHKIKGIFLTDNAWDPGLVYNVVTDPYYGTSGASSYLNTVRYTSEEFTKLRMLFPNLEEIEYVATHNNDATENIYDFSNLKIRKLYVGENYEQPIHKTRIKLNDGTHINDLDYIKFIANLKIQPIEIIEDGKATIDAMHRIDTFDDAHIMARFTEYMDATMEEEKLSGIATRIDHAMVGGRNGAARITEEAQYSHYVDIFNAYTKILDYYYEHYAHLDGKQRKSIQFSSNLLSEFHEHILRNSLDMKYNLDLLKVMGEYNIVIANADLSVFEKLIFDTPGGVTLRDITNLPDTIYADYYNRAHRKIDVPDIDVINMKATVPIQELESLLGKRKYSLNGVIDLSNVTGTNGVPIRMETFRIGAQGVEFILGENELAFSLVKVIYPDGSIKYSDIEKWLQGNSTYYAVSTLELAEDIRMSGERRKPYAKLIHSINGRSTAAYIDERFNGEVVVHIDETSMANTPEVDVVIRHFPTEKHIWVDNGRMTESGAVGANFDGRNIENVRMVFSESNGALPITFATSDAVNIELINRPRNVLSISPLVIRNAKKVSLAISGAENRKFNSARIKDLILEEAETLNIRYLVPEMNSGDARGYYYHIQHAIIDHITAPKLKSATMLPVILRADSDVNGMLNAIRDKNYKKLFPDLPLLERVDVINLYFEYKNLDDLVYQQSEAQRFVGNQYAPFAGRSARFVAPHYQKYMKFLEDNKSFHKDFMNVNVGLITQEENGQFGLVKFGLTEGAEYDVLSHQLGSKAANAYLALPGKLYQKEAIDGDFDPREADYKGTRNASANINGAEIYEHHKNLPIEYMEQYHPPVYFGAQKSNAERVEKIGKDIKFVAENFNQIGGLVGERFVAVRQRAVNNLGQFIHVATEWSNKGQGFLSRLMDVTIENDAYKKAMQEDLKRTYKDDFVKFMQAVPEEKHDLIAALLNIQNESGEYFTANTLRYYRDNAKKMYINDIEYISRHDFSVKRFKWSDIDENVITALDKMRKWQTKNQELLIDLYKENLWGNADGVIEDLISLKDNDIATFNLDKDKTLTSEQIRWLKYRTRINPYVTIGEIMPVGASERVANAFNGKTMSIKKMLEYIKSDRFKQYYTYNSIGGMVFREKEYNKDARKLLKAIEDYRYKINAMSFADTSTGESNSAVIKRLINRADALDSAEATKYSEDSDYFNDNEGYSKFLNKFGVLSTPYSTLDNLTFREEQKEMPALIHKLGNIKLKEYNLNDGYLPNSLPNEPYIVKMIWKDQYGENHIAYRSHVPSEIDAIRLKESILANKDNVIRKLLERGVIDENVKIEDLQFIINHANKEPDYFKDYARNMDWFDLHRLVTMIGETMEGNPAIHEMDNILRAKLFTRRFELRKWSAGGKDDLQNIIDTNLQLTNEIVSRNFKTVLQEKYVHITDSEQNVMPEIRSIGEDYMKEQLRVTRAENAILAAARNISYASVLFNPRHWFVNTTGLITTGLPVLAQYHGADAFKELMTSWVEAKKFIKALKEEELDIAPNFSDKEMELYNAFKKMHDMGVMTPVLTDAQLQGETSTRRQLYIKSQKVLGAVNKVIEEYNRATAAIAGYKYGMTEGTKLVEEGKLAPEELIDYAIKKAIITNAKVNVVPSLNTPLALMKSRGTLRTLIKNQYMFKSYTHNFMHLYSQAFKHGVIEGIKNGENFDKRNAWAFAYANLPLLLMSGLLGLPFANDAKDLMKVLFKKDYEYEIRKFMDNLGGIFANPEFADLLTHGLPTVVGGVDLTKAAGQGDILGQTGIGEAIDAIAGINAFENQQSVLGGLKASYDLLSEPVKTAIDVHDKGWEETLRNRTPMQSIAVIRNLINAYKMNEFGLLNSRKQTILRPEDITWADKAKTMLGFMPQTISKARESEKVKDLFSRTISSAKKEFKEELKNAYIARINGDDPDALGKVIHEINLWNNENISVLGEKIKIRTLLLQALEQFKEENRGLISKNKKRYEKIIEELYNTK